MKIAYVAAGYPDKNNRVKFLFTHEEAVTAQKMGHTVDVYDTSSDTSLFPKNCMEIFEGINVHRIHNFFWNTKKKPFVVKPFTLAKNIFDNFSYLRKFQKNDYDIIIFSFVCSYHLPFLNFSFKKNKKAKFCIIAHGADAMGLWTTKKELRRKRKLLKQMDYVFTRSEATAELVKTMITDSNFYKKIVVCYNGLNTEKLIKAEQKTQSQARELLKLPQNRKFILTVCDLIPRKGVELTLKADAITKQKGVDFLHIIIGRGSEKENLDKIVEENKLQENVLFIPYVENDDEVALYYRASDIYTMISKTIYEKTAMEGFGISYTEAQWLGLPVVGGNTGGVPSAVKDYYSGFLVNPEEKDVVQQIADNFYILLTDEQVYSTMSKNAASFAKATFDWKKTVQKVIDTCYPN